MTASTLLHEQERLEGLLSKYETELNKARRGPMGLTMDEDKTPIWHEAKRLHGIYWKEYQQVNKMLSKMRKLKGYKVENGKRVAIYEYK